MTRLVAYVVSGIAGALVLLLMLVAMTPLMLFQSWVLLELWNWFLPALGVPPLTYATSVGIDIMVAAFITGPVRAHKPKKEGEDARKTDWAGLFTLQIGVYVVALAMGYVAHRYLVP